MILTCEICKSSFTRGAQGPLPKFCFRCRKQRALEASNRFAKQNSEKRRLESKTYFHNHREKEAVRNSRYRETNSKRLLEKNRLNKRNNRSRFRSYEHKRRALLNAAPGQFTKEEFDQLCSKYNHRCLRCGLEKQLVPDHVIPLSKGGTNFITNIQPLCSKCNASKNRHHSTDYRKDIDGSVNAELYFAGQSK